MDKKQYNFKMQPKTSKFAGQIKLDKPIKERMDLKDRKILYLLCKNARFSDTALAKALNMKREVVAYRIKKLSEKDIIHGFFAFVDSLKLGFRNHAIYLSLRDFGEQDKVTKYLSDFDEVSRVQECGGRYDLHVVMSTRNLEDFDRAFKKIFDPISEKINDYIVLEIVEEEFLGLDSDFLGIGKKLDISELKGTAFNKEFARQELSQDSLEPDAKDVCLLKNIMFNSRISFLDLSKKTGIHVSTLKNKISSFVKKGVIRSFFPMISLTHLGYQWYSVFLKVKNLNDKRFVEFLKANPNVLWYVKLVGKWNYQLSIFAKDNSDFNKILTQIRSAFIDNILSHNFVVVFNQHKFAPRIN
ncbi:Lrp/AsnC family transcriptional regulator [Candidatus Woesearchaeota archaeon]|nr:Lrp/AsnC family transcriptional regulator [Candidatus Woesearchaeota archaeon]